MKVERLKSWILSNQLLAFIMSAVLVTILMTGVSLWLYKASGAAKLDLSRPGYEDARAEVEDDNNGTKPFSPTGELNDEAIKDFRNRYGDIKNKLDKTNNYDESDINDDNLGLSPGNENTDSTDQQ